MPGADFLAPEYGDLTSDPMPDGYQRIKLSTPKPQGAVTVTVTYPQHHPVLILETLEELGSPVSLANLQKQLISTLLRALADIGGGVPDANAPERDPEHAAD